MKQDVIVLGAGISGLSCAWYLRKKNPDLKIKILEGSSRAGGLIDFVEDQECYFDLGPKTFKVSRAENLLDLIEDTNLSQDVILSHESAKKKYLYFEKKLHELPSNPLKLITSKIFRRVFFELVNDLRAPKASYDDETIGSFVRRRFGNNSAELIFDPFFKGIFAGDIHKLSVKSCMPQLHELEKEHGSLIKSMFKKKRKKTADEDPPAYPPSSLFNLKGGAVALVKRLTDLLGDSIDYGEKVKEISYRDDLIEIMTKDKIYETKHVVFALPLSAYQKILTPFDMTAIAKQTPRNNLVSVSLAYDKPVWDKAGFGYLVPSIEKSKLLGVVFDSKVFPHLTRHLCPTKLTVMMGGEASDDFLELDEGRLLQYATESLHKHLKIVESPYFAFVKKYKEILPQYLPFHGDRVERFLEENKQKFPNVSFAGNFLEGASVDQCIQRSKTVANGFIAR